MPDEPVELLDVSIPPLRCCQPQNASPSMWPQRATSCEPPVIAHRSWYPQSPHILDLLGFMVV